MPKIVAISDTHDRFKKLVIPECDILISSGDYSFTGEKHIVKRFHKWMAKQPAKHFISVQGNHEKWVEKNFAEAKTIAEAACPGVHFIDEGLVEIEGLKIWCSAITPRFLDWAWNRNRGAEIKVHWDRIPNDIDVLVTHGPPRGILDKVVQVRSIERYEHVGCEDLAEAIKRVKPKVHIFGHIHCGYGETHVDGVSYYNASICDGMYRPANAPHTIEL